MSLKFANRFKKHDFGLARTGGEGLENAAQMSTLPSAYQLIRDKSTDWGNYTASHMEIEGEKDRRLELIDAQSDSLDKQIEAYDQVSSDIDSAESGARTKSTWGNLLKAAGTAAPFVISALSDETTKNTIEELDDACALLRKLRPVSFYYNEEHTESPERMHYGFIAQEYQKVMPDHTYRDMSIDKLCIDTSELVAILVRANQQLQERVTRLEQSFSVLGDK